MKINFKKTLKINYLQKQFNNVNTEAHKKVLHFKPPEGSSTTKPNLPKQSSGNRHIFQPNKLLTFTLRKNKSLPLCPCMHSHHMHTPCISACIHTTCTLHASVHTFIPHAHSMHQCTLTPDASVCTFTQHANLMH